jgi:hypothetical protein
MPSKLGLTIGAALLSVLCATPVLSGQEPLAQRFRQTAQYASPGLEAEVSGIYPHPTIAGAYYALINKRPPYRSEQKAVIDPKYGGSIVTVDRQGKITKSAHLADDDFGGLTYAKGHYYAALTAASEIIEFDPESGQVFRHIALPSPAGGLDYDRDRDAFVAQLYVQHPQLAIIDRASGQIIESLWSEESAMGLVKIGGDWLCSWASGWDPGSFSELRVINQRNGSVDERVILDKPHSVMAALPERDSFMVLVTLDQKSGQTAIREYSYVSAHQPAALAGP